jgi:glutamine synthetase
VIEVDSQLVVSTKKKLEAAGVEYCFASYVDVHGVPKAKCVPLAYFEKMCKGSELFTVGAMEGMGLVGPEKDECAAVPDLSTGVVCPWDKRYAWFASDLYYHGKPYQNCARVILKRAVERARQRGYQFNIGIEPEFYVLKETADGRFVPVTEQYKGTCPAYDVHQTMQSGAFLDPMARYMNELGWGLFSFDQEGGWGQYEFDFNYADCLTMADRFVFLRLMAKNVARGLGLVATFMPKPFSTDFRNGAHHNMSLVDVRTNKNVFVDGEPGALAKKYGLPVPDAAYHFVGGLLKHAGAITAVGCPTYNSYQGLLAQGEMTDISWAPVLRAYGNNNRSAMLRLPMNRPVIENRSPDMSCNPYLTAALHLTAGLEGVGQQTDPGEPLNDNLYNMTEAEQRRRNVRSIPRTLLHALAEFEADELVPETFGAEFRDVYLATKHAEFNKTFFRVTDADRKAMINYV